MEHSTSVDDLVGTFWDESTNLGEKVAPGIINRSASEWSFQEFLKESLSAPAHPAGPIKLRSACKSRFFEDVKQDPTEAQDDEGDGSEPYMRAAELQLYPNSGSTSSSESAPIRFSPSVRVSEILPGLDNVGGIEYSEDYERLLKHKLEMACAAVAMTRVCL